MRTEVKDSGADLCLCRLKRLLPLRPREELSVVAGAPEELLFSPFELHESVGSRKETVHGLFDGHGYDGARVEE